MVLVQAVSNGRIQVRFIHDKKGDEDGYGVEPIDTSFARLMQAKLNYLYHPKKRRRNL